MKAAGLPGTGGGFRRSKFSGRRGTGPVLEVFVVADGHAWRSFDGFGGNEFCGVTIEFVDAVDEGGAMYGFGGVGEWGGSGPLLEEIIDVGAGDGSGLARRRRVDSERKHSLESAELDGAFDFGGHSVTAFGAVGYCFRDGFEDAA